jgi:hypothetical protein
LDVGVTWSAAADKHGVSHEDALHAMVNAIYVETTFDDPRPPTTISPTLYIGPQRDRSAPLLEVMVESTPPRGVHIFHVMPARAKHLARMKEKP